MTDTLFAAEAGEGPQTLVLLHGFAGSHRVWDRVGRALAPQARIIAYDLPGHAGSLHFPGAGPAKVAVRALLDDLARRNIEKAHVAGHSMGGAIAALMALAEPARVASLTLFAPGGFGAEINGRLLRRYAEARDPGDIRNAIEAMSGWSHTVSEQAVSAYAAERAMPGQTEALVGISKIIARDGVQGAIPRDRLAGLAMPVSVVWGTLDTVLPRHQSDGLPPLFALHSLPGAGHMLIDEAPDLAIELIRRQLR